MNYHPRADSHVGENAHPTGNFRIFIWGLEPFGESVGWWFALPWMLSGPYETSEMASQGAIRRIGYGKPNVNV